MEACESVSIELWYDAQYNEGRSWLRADIPNSKGIKRISFLFFGGEFEAYCKGKQDSFKDGYHQLSTFDEISTFCNFEIPQEPSGIAQIPFITLNINRWAKKVMLRLANNVWKTKSETRREFYIPLSTRKRWCSKYGRGSGEAVFDPTEQATNIINSYGMEKTFKEGLETITRIAKNSTYSFRESARVYLSMDDAKSLYFNIMNPKKQRVMNGGLIFHNSSDEWSIHT